MVQQQLLNDSSAVARQCARKLFELRGQTGQTQKALAARLGMTESMISAIIIALHSATTAQLRRSLRA